MSTRCIPFGLFAGCSIGRIDGDKTSIVLKDLERHTRFDMHFLCRLSQEISNLSGIKEKLRYFPNTTLYRIGKKYRFLEYGYNESEVVHQISSVDCTAYLRNIIKMARMGVKIDKIVVLS